MADSKASALTLASALTGTELWAGVQGGADRRITAQLLADFVIGLISDGAPAALDTLNELAAALADDASYAATVTTALAGKQPLDSDLTAIAALTTTSFGRSLLTLADAMTLRDGAVDDRQVVTPVDGGSYAIAASSKWRIEVYLENSGTLSAYTVTLPTLLDGQALHIYWWGAITSFTMTQASGQPIGAPQTTAAANGRASWKYSASAGRLYRTG